MVTLTRIEAGRRLAQGLEPFVTDAQLAVVALSAGGMRVAAEIARQFEAPLDIITACRLEVPGRLHSAFGAVADGSTLTLPDRVSALGLPEDYVAGLVERTRREIEWEASAWRGGAPAVDVTGCTVVLADDGLAEAVLVAAAAQALRAAGAGRVIFVAPSAGGDLCRALERLVDGRVLLVEPGAPVAACPCLRDPTFAQTTRLDVHQMVRRSRPPLVAGRPLSRAGSGPGAGGGVPASS